MRKITAEDKKRLSVVIQDLEREWKFFNRIPLGLPELLTWAKGLRINVITDHSQKDVRLLWIDPGEKAYICYNPDWPADLQTFAVAREIARFLLRRHQDMEWAAPIIAQMCLTPSD